MLKGQGAPASCGGLQHQVTQGSSRLSLGSLGRADAEAHVAWLGRSELESEYVIGGADGRPFTEAARFSAHVADFAATHGRDDPAMSLTRSARTRRRTGLHDATAKVSE